MPFLIIDAVVLVVGISIMSIGGFLCQFLTLVFRAMPAARFAFCRIFAILLKYVCALQTACHIFSLKRRNAGRSHGRPRPIPRERPASRSLTYAVTTAEGPAMAPVREMLIGRGALIDERALPFANRKDAGAR
jgi:hypothetical protein